MTHSYALSPFWWCLILTVPEYRVSPTTKANLQFFEDFTLVLVNKVKKKEKERQEGRDLFICIHSHPSLNVVTVEQNILSAPAPPPPPQQYPEKILLFKGLK